MTMIETLKADYARFPADQTYSLYAPDVYFQDPVNRFQGIDRYRQMIGWMATWFQEIRMDLHSIHQDQAVIHTEWTLSWTVALPWKPRIRVDGWSDLTLNAEGLIQSHIDGWKCSRWDVIQQVFRVHASASESR